MSVKSVALFTDFGVQSLYLAEVEAAVRQLAPSVHVYTLVADAPRCDPLRSGYLLAAISHRLPAQAIVIGVVDPGVGTGQRLPIVLETGGRVYVGPGNSLFSRVSQEGPVQRLWEIVWTPDRLSTTFHGRDLFAPIAARLATGTLSPDALRLANYGLVATPRDLWEIIYIDHFGNAITGIRGPSVNAGLTLCVRGTSVRFATTFGEVAPQQPFWYVNSMGLIEIAANGISLAQRLNVRLGSEITLVDDDQHLHFQPGVRQHE